ncbi:unnamed protein product [Chrysoparadoxa australica]
MPFKSLLLLLLGCSGTLAAPSLTGLESHDLEFPYYQGVNSLLEPYPAAPNIYLTKTIAVTSGTNVVSATVTLSNISGDTVHKGSLQIIEGTGILAGTYAESTGVLTITGSDTAANYQSTLRAIVYRPAKEYALQDNPNEHVKRVSFQVANGDTPATSGVVTRNINLSTCETAYNDLDPGERTHSFFKKGGSNFCFCHRCDNSLEGVIIQ